MLFVRLQATALRWYVARCRVRRIRAYIRRHRTAVVVCTDGKGLSRRRREECSSCSSSSSPPKGTSSEQCAHMASFIHSSIPVSIHPHHRMCVYQTKIPSEESFIQVRSDYLDLFAVPLVRLFAVLLGFFFFFFFFSNALADGHLLGLKITLFDLFDMRSI